MKVLAMMILFIYNVNAQSATKRNPKDDINVNIISVYFNGNLSKMSEVGLSFEKSISKRKSILLGIGKTSSINYENLDGATNMKIGMKLKGNPIINDTGPSRTRFLEIETAGAMKEDKLSLIGVVRGGVQIELMKGFVIQPAIGFGMLMGADDLELYSSKEDPASGSFVDFTVSAGYMF